MARVTPQEVHRALQALGTEQTRKTYRRHGAGDDLYGVSFADLGKLKKKIGIDHALAIQLWDSGNADARALATMIADPRKLTEGEADAWAGGTRYYVIADLLSATVVTAPFATKKMAEWTASPDEWVGQAGWNLMAWYAIDRDGAFGDVPDPDFEDVIRTIEQTIHAAKNRTRHAMNGALIAIGMRNPRLATLATAAAKRIGKVVVDHGQTSCKTPDAAAYIQKANARKEQRSAVARR